VNYTVIWLPEAERDLAALWLDALDRGIVTKAVAGADNEPEA
jgi:hypothetical protein